MSPPDVIAQIIRREKEGKEKYRTYCPIVVGTMATHALVDSGNSAGNAMSWQFAQQLGLREEDLEPDPALTVVNTAKQHEALRVLGRPKRKLTLQLGGLSVKFKDRPLVIQGLSMPFNLAGPFLCRHHIDQLHSKQVLRVQGKEIPLRTATRGEDGDLRRVEPRCSIAYVSKDVQVPANCVGLVPLRIPDVEAGRRQPGEGLLEAHAHFVERTDVHPVIAALCEVDTNGQCWTTVMNTTEEDLVVPKGLRYGELSRATATGATAVSSLQPAKEFAHRDQEWYVKRFSLQTSPFLKDPKDLKSAVKLLREFGDLFSENDDYGKTELVQHEIHTQEGPPIKCRHRPLNPALEPNLREQIDHWEAQEVIEPSTSPWSFPLIAVPKKNGKTRWCVDYRRLNEITIKDSFPLPQIEDNLARLAHSRIFSGIDGTGAYHVVTVREQDRPKTAFSTPWGLYQFKQMPFGLCNAPATYCRLVQKVLAGIPLSVAIPYLDDTCIHSKTLDEHLEGLRRVFEAHRRAGLTLQPEKCQLF